MFPKMHQIRRKMISNYNVFDIIKGLQLKAIAIGIQPTRKTYKNLIGKS